MTTEFTNNWTHQYKRLAIFASYDKDGQVSETVLYYLTGLKRCVDAIAFIADNEVLPGELQKLSGLVCYASAFRHGEYDFGSYKRGFEWFEKRGMLDDAEEIVMCNDSCYGPIFPFETVFSRMSQVSCDFWGMMSSNMSCYHIQSYFYVFRRRVFTSTVFKEIVYGFAHQTSWKEYINQYELTLTEKLLSAGFVASAYTEAVERDMGKVGTFGENNPTVYPETLFSWRVPLIKKKAFTDHCETTLRESIVVTLENIKKVNPRLYELMECDLQKTFGYEKSVIGLPDWYYIAARYGGVERLLDIIKKKLISIPQIEVMSLEIEDYKQTISCLQANELYLAKKNKRHLRQILLLWCLILLLCVYAVFCLIM